MSQPTVLPSLPSDGHNPLMHRKSSSNNGGTEPRHRPARALDKHMLSSIMVVSSTDEDEDERAFASRHNSPLRVAVTTSQPQRPIVPGAPSIEGVLNTAATTKLASVTAMHSNNSNSNSGSMVRMRGRKPSFLEADGTVVPIRPRSPTADGTASHPPIPLRPLNPNMSTPAEKHSKKKKQTEKLQKLHDRANSPTIEKARQQEPKRRDEEGEGDENASRQKKKDGGQTLVLPGDGVVSYRPSMPEGEHDTKNNNNKHNNSSVLPEKNGDTEKVLPNTVRSPSMTMDLVELPHETAGDTPDSKNAAAVTPKQQQPRKETNTPFRALHIAPLARLEDELEAHMQQAAQAQRGGTSPFFPRNDVEVDDDDDDDLEEFMVCPFSVLSCCPEGRHARRDLTHPRLVHQHALAVARTTQELRADHAVLQQQYCNMQKKFKSQKTAMAQMQNDIEQLRQYILSAHGEGERGGSTSTSGGSGGGAKEGGRRASTEKALPRDVSHVLEDEMEEKEGHTEGTYARRLRIRTTSAACLYEQPAQQMRETNDRRGAAALPNKVLSEEVQTPKYGPRACSHHYPSSEVATADASEAVFSSYRDESAISPISSASLDMADLDREGDGELAAMHALIRSPSASPQLVTAAAPSPGPSGRRQEGEEKKYPLSPLSAPSLVSTTHVPAQLAAMAAPPPATEPTSGTETDIAAADAMPQKEKELRLAPPSPRSSRSPSNRGGSGMTVTLTRRITLDKSSVEAEPMRHHLEAGGEGAKQKRSASKHRGASPRPRSHSRKNVPADVEDGSMQLLDQHAQSLMQPSRPSSEFARETLTNQQRPLLRNAASHAHLKKRVEL